MTKEKFWQIIESSKLESKYDLERQEEILQTKLESLSPDEIVLFNDIFDKFSLLRFN